MHIVRYVSLPLMVMLSMHTLFSQSSVKYNNQQLFLSGSNLAWMSFANDIGPGTRDFTAFGDILLQMHNHGGNALRWWLHTNGTVSPAFNDTGLVIGPGSGTIESLRRALDIAWQREIGVKLCLWSFDMLRATNSPSVVERNLKLLGDTAYISAYINKCLIPMVDSLKRHPAIIAWEIFNEPEGMSNEFYFYRVDPHVPMSTIQRFVNLCAGAIHRRDSAALVTNGTWSFKALTDVPLGSLTKVGTGVNQLGAADRQQMLKSFNKKYGFAFSSEEFDAYLQRIALLDNYNYYSDSRLIAAGADPKGTLDFYSVHYYDWGGTPISPFHHPSGTWLLDKPIVVAEFALKDTYGVLKEDVYKTLFRNGYAGALAWSWTDVAFSSAEDMLAGMQSLWDNYRSAVDVRGVGGDWASVAITSPRNDSVFAASAQITIQATATVNDDGRVVLVEFFANDTLKIGERTSAPYTVTWTNPPSGLYALTAVATGNLGHKSGSNKVRIQIGSPSTVRLEAEAAAKEGDIANMFVRSLQTASGGAYVEMRTQTGKITWTLPAVSTAGTYDLLFGYRLSFATPKTQTLNVNGTRVNDVVFDGVMNTWLEKKQSVTLVPGSNTIQLELSWGWMDFDYLAVPRSLTTAVENTIASLPASFSLEQNYPNPFSAGGGSAYGGNPTTAISFHLPGATGSGQADLSPGARNAQVEASAKAGVPAPTGAEGSAVSFVTLKVFDILGREVATLLNDVRSQGTHVVRWDASGLPSGVYFYRLEAGGFIQTKKLTLLR